MTTETINPFGPGAMMIEAFRHATQKHGDVLAAKAALRQVPKDQRIRGHTNLLRQEDKLESRVTEARNYLLAGIVVNVFPLEEAADSEPVIGKLIELDTEKASLTLETSEGDVSIQYARPWLSRTEGFQSIEQYSGHVATVGAKIISYDRAFDWVFR